MSSSITPPQFISLSISWPEADGVEEAEAGHEEAPPEGGVEVGEDGRAGVPELVDALAEDDGAAGEGEDADEEPDGERLLGAGIDGMRGGHGVLLGGVVREQTKAKYRDSGFARMTTKTNNEQKLRTSKDEMRGSLHYATLRSG